MHNWSVDTKKLAKYPKEYTIWKLEQMINFDLNGRKLKLAELKRNFSKLHIDPQKKSILSFYLLSK